MNLGNKLSRLKNIATTTSIAVLLCASANIAVSAENAPLTPLPAGSVSVENGNLAWQKIFEVFSHPRCANCHVDDSNIPMWSGPHYGAGPRVHGMNINAGESRIGAETLPCGTCHQKQNSPLSHGAPGAENWALAPVEMQWFGKTSAEICAQIKDPLRNGGRTVFEVAEHIDHDKLVHWGWKPGSGREPAPGSIAETVQTLLEWDASGSPCPAQ